MAQVGDEYVDPRLDPLGPYAPGQPFAEPSVGAQIFRLLMRLDRSARNPVAGLGDLAEGFEQNRTNRLQSIAGMGYYATQLPKPSRGPLGSMLQSIGVLGEPEYSVEDLGAYRQANALAGERAKRDAVLHAQLGAEEDRRKRQNYELLGQLDPESQRRVAKELGLGEDFQPLHPAEAAPPTTFQKEEHDTRMGLLDLNRSRLEADVALRADEGKHRRIADSLKIKAMQAAMGNDPKTAARRLKGINNAISAWSKMLSNSTKSDGTPLSGPEQQEIKKNIAALAELKAKDGMVGGTPLGQPGPVPAPARQPNVFDDLF